MNTTANVTVALLSSWKTISVALKFVFDDDDNDDDDMIRLFSCVLLAVSNVIQTRYWVPVGQWAARHG